MGLLPISWDLVLWQLDPSPPFVFFVGLAVLESYCPFNSSTLLSSIIAHPVTKLHAPSHQKVAI